MYFNFKTQLLNLIPKSFISWEPYSPKEERFIARKLSSLIHQTYTNKLVVNQNSIEYELVEKLYELLVQVCGPQELGMIPSTIKGSEILIYYGECSQNSNYQNLYILPNGSIFLSESFLEEVLEIGGVEALTFVILHELAHIIKRDIIKNLIEGHRYGDLKKQYFQFENQYIGFDALFLDYYTNTRFNLDQEFQADQLALKIMKEIGMNNLRKDQYKKILLILENETKNKQLMKQISPSIQNHRKLILVKSINQIIESNSKKLNQEDIKQIITNMKMKIDKVRGKFEQKEVELKEERIKKKQLRDYEIYDQMPYKYNTKIYNMKERHPLSKERFESANLYIENELWQKSDESEKLRLMFKCAFDIYQDKKLKVRRIKAFD